MVARYYTEALCSDEDWKMKQREKRATQRPLALTNVHDSWKLVTHEGNVVQADMEYLSQTNYWLIGGGITSCVSGSTD
jgi:hypothetical protein